MRPDIRRIDWINSDLARTRKAMVILGCSFGVGKAAYDEDLVAYCRPLRHEHWGDCDYRHIKFTEDQYNYLTEKHDLTRDHDGSLYTVHMEQQNGFGPQLCDMLNREWTPVNLSASGHGNFGSVDRLHWAPVDWSLADEIIVLFSMSDTGRIDVPINSYKQGFTANAPERFYKPCFPNFPDESNNDGRELSVQLTESFGHDIEAFYTTHWLKVMTQLNNWCKRMNAHLVAFPGFSSMPTRESCYSEFYLPSTVDEDFIDNIPWDSIIRPGGAENFFDLCLRNEYTYYRQFIENPEHMHSFVYIPEEHITMDWVMPCGHPSKRGHKLLAEVLHTHLTNKGWI